MNAAVESTHRKPNNWTLVVLALLFAFPPIAGWVYFLNPDLLPTSKSNHGQLIQPSRSVGDLTLATRDGSPLDWNLFNGKWVLVTLARNDCSDACINRIFETGQIRKAVGANRQRVERLLVISEPSPAWKSSISNEQLDGAVLAAPASDSQGQLEAGFSTDNKQLSETYIIDPNGMLMMHYVAGTPNKLILKDLEKLLKASQSWAQGGQYGHR